MNFSENLDTLFITAQEVGQRLDKILAARFEGHYSRTYFQYLIDQHLVLLNGFPVKKRVKPLLDDEIEIQFSTLPDLELVAENIPLTILYEDDHLIAINKPAGMVVHPAPGNWSGTFVNALFYYCKTLPDFDQSLRPGIVHRLDKETSGVLLAAKTLDAQQKMTELFALRQVYKEYVAICIGKPSNHEIRTGIGRHPILRKQMIVREDGKEAITIPTVLKANERFSLVKLVILTGRTHQIRVHLKHVGSAVLGDKVYGNTSINQHLKIDRQFLHAGSIKFIHPITHKSIEIQAPLPLDMQNFVSKNFLK